MWIRGFLIAGGLWLTVAVATAEELQVAVASNFSATARKLAAVFEGETGRQITLATGSTGKHYAQIRNGAPFDVFLAGDALHPTMLEESVPAAAGSRFTYAIGQLVLWSPVERYVDPQGKVLGHGRYRHLAMANPDLAPYGLAARETLESLGLWKRLQDRAVRGENIAQAFQFVASGSAELGFVALSQITNPGNTLMAGSYWRVPQELYTPIDQQAVLLTDSAAARRFLVFLRSDSARATIQQDGYKVPESRDD